VITETIKLYEDREDVTLTNYVIADSPEMPNGKNRPAVIICPGGAYLSCSDREAEPVALRFAAMGYHAFVLCYSTYFEGKPNPFPPSANMDINPNSVYPAPMRDIGKAFLTIHTHAEKWLVDTEKIVICGFSAGAHNCAMYSVSWNEPVITEFFGEPANTFKPAASILGYGVLDYRLMFGLTSDDPMAQVISDAASIAYMGTKSPTPEFLETISPVLHVSPNTPPTFLWATGEDALVPVENTTRMANALAHAGVPFEVHVFESGPHGLSLANQSTAGSLFEIDTDAQKWIILVESWLKKRFALPLLEKPIWMSAMESNIAK